MKRSTNKKPKAKALSARRQQRAKTPPVLFEKTQRLVKRIDELIDGTFLTYWTSESGSICANDVQAMYEALRVVQPAGRITLFVKSAGGDGQSALRLIHLLREHAAHLTVLAPLECASA